MLLKVYRIAMAASTPLLAAYLRKRAAKGKEDPTRAHERRGQPRRARGGAPLVWLHAASVGESLSLLAVVDRLLQDYPEIDVMVTTGTVTSARLMAERLPARAFHQYVPVDHPLWVASFLDHWRPDCVLWAESDLWPNMLSEIKRRRIPAMLLNARISPESFLRWKLAKGMIREILSAFTLCIAQNAGEADRLSQLGARAVKVGGNLKYAAEPLPFDAASLERLQRETTGRKTILWASTHAGEEKIAVDMHRALREAFPEVLTIIVPRHPKRGGEIAALVREAGFSPSRRSEGGAVTDIYIADTLGELGVFYRLCKNVVMGGSFVDVGGHNPIEPAQLGCIIFFGPFFYNFVTILEEFRAYQAVVEVTNKDDLLKKLADALESPGKFQSFSKAAEKLTADKRHIVDDIMQEAAFLLKKERAA